MKYTIEGFSQEVAVNLGLNCEDLVILRWFVDFYNSDKMAKMEFEGQKYAWVNYKGFLEQMPIIKCTKKTLAGKFKRLVDAEVLTNKTIKQGGTFSVYGFGKNFTAMLDSSILQTVTENQATVAEKEVTPLPENEQPRYPKIGNQKTSLLYNTSLLNKTKKEYKERDLSIATGSSLDAQDSSLECDTDFNADNGIKKDTFYQRVRDDKPVLMNGVDISYAFSMLYSFYPKRVGKKEAASAFLDLVRENTKDRIIELAINIDTYKKYTFDNGTESKYIKNMQGFISSTQYNEYEKYNCDVLIGGKYYKTKRDYMDAVISGEVEMYLLPRSCITL